ncbi:MAG TPA: cupin domain-containing protein [Candidatus Limnocylindrales bacterium]|nr:cupin domain-containing protein [Candidatus Limnocylindrales bacterium]
MIRPFGALTVSPEPYADYRTVFETGRLNVTHVRISPGATVPTHTHHDEDQVYFVATGTGYVVLDGVRTDVSAGDSVLIPLGTEHEITNTGSEPLDYVFFVVFVPPRG